MLNQNTKTGFIQSVVWPVLKLAVVWHSQYLCLNGLCNNLELKGVPYTNQQWSYHTSISSKANIPLPSLWQSIWAHIIPIIYSQIHSTTDRWKSLATIDNHALSFQTKATVKIVSMLHCNTTVKIINNTLPCFSLFLICVFLART